MTAPFSSILLTTQQFFDIFFSPKDLFSKQAAISS